MKNKLNGVQEGKNEILNYYLNKLETIDYESFKRFVLNSGQLPKEAVVEIVKRIPNFNELFIKVFESISQSNTQHNQFREKHYDSIIKIYQDQTLSDNEKHQLVMGLEKLVDQSREDNEKFYHKLTNFGKWAGGATLALLAFLAAMFANNNRK